MTENERAIRLDASLATLDIMERTLRQHRALTDRVVLDIKAQRDTLHNSISRLSAEAFALLHPHTVAAFQADRADANV